MSFDDRPYMMDLYLDESKEIIIQKSVQCGVSEWLVVRSLANAENGLSTFYVLPTFTLRNTFVQNRVAKLFEVVPYYAQRLKHAEGSADSTSMKHYAKAALKFVGSNTPNEFKEFPADVMVIDEYDECDQTNIAKAPDRIKSSDHRIQIKIGNPTFDDFGINGEYQRSDQKEWAVECEHCGKYQALDWFKQVVREITEKQYELIDREWDESQDRDIRTYCIHCGKPFNRLNSRAFWRAENPKSRISGYHFTRMMQSNTTIRELFSIFQTALTDQSKLQAFYNSDLGLSFSAKSVSLSDFLLNQCCQDYVMPSSSTFCVMGVDVGSVLHVKISKVEGKKRISQFIGTVHSFEEIDRLIEQYDVMTCVVDALPETHEAKKLRDRQMGRVYLCSYTGGKGSVNEMRIDEKDMHVTIDRTQSMDESHSDILLKNMVLPKEAKNLDNGDFYKQMQKPKRKFDETSGRYIWTDEKPDHYRHADNYEKIAMKILGEGPKIWAL